LEVGTQAAIEIHQREPEISLEPEWEEPHSTNTTMRTPAPVATKSSWLPWTALILVLILGGFWSARTPPEAAAPITAPVVVEETARLVATTSVKATFALNGEVIGQGESVEIDDLKPNRSYTLRVEANGYTPHEKAITLDAGKNSIYVQLQASPGRSTTKNTTSTPQPVTPGAPTSTIVLTSSPPRANVFVTGALIGRTPYTWSTATPGAALEVSYELSGYESSVFDVTAPDTDGVLDKHRDLQRVARAAGRISINVSPGWGYIELDGQRIQGETTPLTDYKLSAGPHVVRVFHAERGLNETKNVTIKSGQTETVWFQAE